MLTTLAHDKGMFTKAGLKVFPSKMTTTFLGVIIRVSDGLNLWQEPIQKMVNF